MGRRIIISETERKNILSLYESTNVAPPPSESILIAKKNPFITCVTGDYNDLILGHGLKDLGSELGYWKIGLGLTELLQFVELFFLQKIHVEP